VEVRILGPDDDGARLAREAADAGTPALGVAGGDGTLGPIAAVAVERGLGFVCVPFGTRNHFARDAGIDVDDPLGALAAFDGTERNVDVGEVDGRVFLNNVSLGIYGSFVHEEKRKTKNRALAALRLLPAAVGRSRDPLELSFEVDGRREDHRVLVLLVGNNDYSLRSLADMGGRERLDGGSLHACLVEATTRRRLVALLARAMLGGIEKGHSWTGWSSKAFSVESRRRELRAALDGEPVVLRPPLQFAVNSLALRLLVPRSSDGGPAAPAAS
jgi:diacylglycerol kinase family enzyme